MFVVDSLKPPLMPMMKTGIIASIITVVRIRCVVVVSSLFILLRKLSRGTVRARYMKSAMRSMMTKPASRKPTETLATASLGVARYCRHDESSLKFQKL